MITLGFIQPDTLFRLLHVMQQAGEALPHHANVTVQAGDLRHALGINPGCNDCQGKGFTCDAPELPLATQHPAACPECFPARVSKSLLTQEQQAI